MILCAVKDTPDLLDGVEVDSVIDNVGVDHSVCVALEKRSEVHDLVLVIVELLGIGYQFHLELSHKGPISLPISEKSVQSSNLLQPAAAGGGCAGRVECKVQAPSRSGNLQFLLH